MITAALGAFVAVILLGIYHLIVEDKGKSINNHTEGEDGKGEKDDILL